MQIELIILLIPNKTSTVKNKFRKHASNLILLNICLQILEFRLSRGAEGGFPNSFYFFVIFFYILVI